ncbi:Small subunit (SSU) processome component [Komagataella phaffii CBS 7435]|uniref:Nucleolar protein, specifically associated with the U3 snoRNA n=2 Tax=Komagataella phaffii TaxID=460519 RepID=C4R169_KOMPG|nr:Nucleolar protein, specifically associated with the U3 snoRNA [Komagataella phaffii GS115]AOA62930.1 GQ67_00664T0 [Komagataella phaffii]CAH2448230.1 Small subunit (SSU) processome component [Komagataella phaffii CBS 7435]AOA67278.1 GQ68_00724T0 [Komagataella phaffii GS115]CAY69243.1 Nucleolar protein, specifically associated with the U3 snoRNA [Komagataella phaffii GS115]CCA38365.1 Small subunit (SSU) processome component [Komagataella phaffii CBS 7435]
MVKSYQRYELGKSFGVISSDSNIVYLPQKKSTGKVITGGLEDILVWDIKTGELSQKLHDGIPIGAADASVSGAPSQVVRLEYHHNNNIVAAGYSDGSIKIWDLTSGTVVMSLQGHRSAVTILVFDRSGTRLVSGSRDSTMIVWDLVGETGLFKLKGHKNEITGLLLLDGTEAKDDEEMEDWLVSVSKDGLIKLWDLKAQQCIETHVAHSGECWSLGIDIERRIIITTGTENKCKVWTLDLDAPNKVSERGLFEKKSKQRGLTTSFKTIRGNSFFFIQNADRTVEIFRLRSDAEIQKAVTKRTRTLKEKGLDEDEVEENLKSGDINRLIQNFATVRSMAKIRNCTWTEKADLLISLNNNSVEYYTVSLPENVKKHQSTDMIYKKAHSVEAFGHRTDIRFMDISDDGKLLTTASNGLLKVWNVNSLNCIRTFECGYGLVVKFLPGGALLVLGTREGNLELYDLASSTVLDSIQAHEGALYQLDITPDGKSVITGGADKQVKKWDIKLEMVEVLGSKEKVASMSLVNSRNMEMNDEILAVKVSPDQQLLAVSTTDNCVRVFYLDTLKFFLNLYGHKLPVLSIDISQDNKIIITSSADKNIKIWGLDFGDCHKSIFGHQDSIMSVRFISNTHHFITTSKDGMVKYWDGDKFECIQKLAAHQSEVWCSAVSLDGSFFVTASHDHSIRIWEETNDEVFIQEEREKEMDEQYEETLLASLEEDEDSLAKRKEEIDEVTGVTKQTMESLKAGEKLMEALDLGTKELDAQEEYEQTLAAFQLKKTLNQPIKPTPNTILVVKKMTPAEYVLSIVLAIKASQLEDALLVLPFSYTIKLFRFIQIWTDSENGSKNIVNLSTISRLVFTLVRNNCKELISQKEDKINQLIISVRDQLRKQLSLSVDDIGYNVEGLKFLKAQWKLAHSTEFIDEEEQKRYEEKHVQKRVYQTVE